MSARTGQQYIEDLKDNRTVWLGREKVKVTEHPAFAGSLQGMAGYFDWQHQYSDDCLVENPEAGCKTNASLLVPRNAEDLKKRNRSYERLARYSYGMLGRTPDYVQTVLSGFAGRSDGFIVDGDRTYADRLEAYHREVARGDLSLTHAIIHPVIDKAVSAVDGINADMALRVVERKKDSVIVRGARVLATKSPFADEIYVYPSINLPPGTPSEFAISFAIPMETKGLHIVCRDHTGVDSPVQDAPFSSRFDEQDGFIIFDNVEVPLDRVFIDGSLEVYGSSMQLGWSSNVLQQTCIRSAVKLEFIHDMCSKMAEITNAKKNPAVASMLGELRSYVNLARGAVKAGEAEAFDHGNGAFFLNPAPLRAIKALMPSWMIRANEIVIALGSHNLLCAPSSALHDDAEIGPLISRYLLGSNDKSARERSQVFRTAWDFVGSALGSRVALYERYYLASSQTSFMLESKIADAESKGSLFDDFVREFKSS